MKPLQHAMISAHRYGGGWTDWIAFHNWIDQSKAVFASMQHRMLLHSDFGAWLARRVLGETVTGPEGVAVKTSALFDDHQLEDLGRTVPLSEWLRTSDTERTAKRRRPPRELTHVRESPADGLAARWGGAPADYAALVAFFDMPATLAPDYADAAALVTHSSFGIFLAEQLFGNTILLPAGRPRLDSRERVISTRSPAEDLVHARMGWIPSASHLPVSTRLKNWMRGTGVRAALRERHAGDKCGVRIEELLDSCSAAGAHTRAAEE